MKSMFVYVSLAATLATGCAGSHPDDHAEQSARARKAAEALTGRLLGELTQAMKNGGPSAAVRYCARNAQTVTSSVGLEHRLAIRRVTDRPRNAADAPDAWERDVLDDLDMRARAGTLATDAVHEEVREVDGRLVLRVMKPIIVRQPCLACHGTERDIAPDVARIIREEYPDDRATGYVVGDFRGAISVQVPLED
mgnify:FL=1